ncbi:hypothetical protein ACQPZF_13425 [Actinosynnema sp. CS-041913]|uniref:hypothetical protein n=1 Tax=Actinosynnema sp. CS-041913 TaxID=3239917 RepID=UPI003D94931A
MSVHEFAESLRTLHVECGKPSYTRIRELAPEHPLPPATVSEVLNGRRLPKADFVQAFVRAVLRHRDGGDSRRHDDEVARWRRKWQQAVLRPRRSPLDRGLAAQDEEGRRWGDATLGCFALYGLDGEAVYIGQADTSLGGAVRARLAMLPDPVAEVELWPAWHLSTAGPALDLLERGVYRKAFGAPVDLPPSHRFALGGNDDDACIARRAEDLARLASSVLDGGPAAQDVRRTLAVQATQLARLATARFTRLTGQSVWEADL